MGIFECFESLQGGKWRPKVVLFTVYLAMLLDCMLFTIVVPILPDYLIKISEDSSYLETSLNREAFGENFTFIQNNNSYHEAFVANNIPIAFLLGSKAVMQIPTSFAVSQITYRIGYSIPLFIGFVVICSSSLMFAFSKSYWTLLIARALNGVGSGFTATSGLGMLAQTFTDNHERGKAIAFAFGGIAIGIMVGPVVGGILYKWGGIVLPFTLLAAVALLEGFILLTVLRLKVDKVRPEHTNYSKLLSDPYILITAAAIAVSNLAFAMLEPALPLWMIENWGSDASEQGLAFLPSSLAYMIGTNMFAVVSKKFGRWQCGFVGFLCIAGAAIANIYQLIIPNCVLGLGLGLVDTNMFPMLGHIADLRHTNVYGSVYAIGDASACLAFAFGPFTAGPIVRFFGMMAVMAILNLACAPFMFIIKRLPDKVPESPTSMSEPRMSVSVLDTAPEYIKN